MIDDDTQSHKKYSYRSKLIMFLCLDARRGGLVTLTVSSACVPLLASPAVRLAVTRPAASVPAGGTLPGDSATPALQDTTTILTASVRTR